MAFLLSSMLCLAQIGGISAVANLNQRFLDRLDMQPSVVAGTLAQVENNWRDEMIAFLECNASHAGSKDLCARPQQAFLKSCSGVMSAVVKASSGQRAVVNEYMQDVCGQSVLQGVWKDGCFSFASALGEGMTDDSYTNRVDLSLVGPCTNLFQTLSVGEEKRIAREAEERVAMEKKMAEERADAERKAAVERAEAERKATEARAAAERKAAEEAKKKLEEEKKRLEQEAKKRAEEAKKKAEEAANQAEIAKKKAAEAAAEAAKKLKEKSDAATKLKEKNGAAAKLKEKSEKAQQKSHGPKLVKAATAAGKTNTSTGGEKPSGLVKAAAAPTPRAPKVTVVAKAAGKKDTMAGAAANKTSSTKHSKL